MVLTGDVNTGDYPRAASFVVSNLKCTEFMKKGF